MDLYHFFDRRTGPFRSLSRMPREEAESLLGKIRAERPDSLCAQRDGQYVEKRHSTEALLRREFAARGGIMEIESPYYMVVEFSPWLYSWYEQPAYIRIPAEEFDLRTVSFTYGDSMPTFSDRVNDGKEYRKKLYLYDEIPELIRKYGLPQDWNDDGKHGPERYIEAHVWTRNPVERYMSSRE